jgi:hypothetical protein
MRGAVQGVTPLWSIRMREPTTSVFILESGGADAPYCTNDCQYCHGTRRKLKLETAYYTQSEICEQIRMTLKTPFFVFCGLRVAIGNI